MYVCDLNQFFFFWKIEKFIYNFGKGRKEKEKIFWHLDIFLPQPFYFNCSFKEGERIYIYIYISEKMVGRGKKSK